MRVYAVRPYIAVTAVTLCRNGRIAPAAPGSGAAFTATGVCTSLAVHANATSRTLATFDGGGPGPGATPFRTVVARHRLPFLRDLHSTIYSNVAVTAVACRHHESAAPRLGGPAAVSTDLGRGHVVRIAFALGLSYAENATNWARLPRKDEFPAPLRSLLAALDEGGAVIWLNCTPPPSLCLVCNLCMQDHGWNTQGRIVATPPPVARRASRPRLARVWPARCTRVSFTHRAGPKHAAWPGVLFGRESSPSPAA